MTASVQPRVSDPQSTELRSDAPVSRPWNLKPRDLAILMTILLATALIYIPSIRHGWVGDDKAQTIDATELHSWAGVGKSFLHDSWWFREGNAPPP